MSKSDRIKDYFDQTETYLRSNAVISLRKRIIKDFLGEQTNKKFLDIGCGDGSLLGSFLSDNQITYLDLSQKMLDIVRENIPEDYMGNARFENRDIFSYNSQQRFDIIICIGVISHVENVKNLLKKIHELSEADGLIILQYTDDEKLISRINNFRYRFFSKNNYKYEINRIRTSQLIENLDSMGLKIVKRANHFPVSPFFSPFSYKKKVRLLNWSYENHLLSDLGSESLLLLSKS